MGDDHDLLDQISQGDIKALQHIYEKYRYRLLALALRMKVSLDMAEDILHDVMVSLVQRAHRLQLQHSLYSYLATGMINGVRDLYRKQARARRRHETTFSLSVDHEPDGRAMTHEQTQRLDRCMEQLPKEQRDVVMMRMHQDLKFDEIARIQGICSSTARGRYRYGLGKLSELMHAG